MPGPFLGTAPAPGTVPQWPQPRRKSGDAMAVENWTWTQDDPGFFASTVDNTYPTSVEGKHEDPRWGQIWGLQMAGCTFPTDGSTLDGPNCWVYFYIGSIMFCWCVYIYLSVCVPHKRSMSWAMSMKSRSTFAERSDAFLFGHGAYPWGQPPSTIWIRDMDVFGYYPLVI